MEKIYTAKIVSASPKSWYSDQVGVVYEFLIDDPNFADCYTLKYWLDKKIRHKNGNREYLLIRKSDCQLLPQKTTLPDLDQLYGVWDIQGVRITV